MDNEEISRKILISGSNNKYKINKILNSNIKEMRKRVTSEKWNFPIEYFEYCNQMKLIVDISNNNFTSTCEVSKIVVQEISKKICGYKQQDKIKKIFNENNFLTFESVINKMIECKLKCRYCLNEMFILYDISREIRQWSVDRINNDIGHDIDNFHLACLDCNLKRRRRTDEKFLFTKQLNIVKQDK
jgi:hypothetical protein